MKDKIYSALLVVLVIALIVCIVLIEKNSIPERKGRILERSPFPLEFEEWEYIIALDDGQVIVMRTQKKFEVYTYVIIRASEIWRDYDKNK